MRLETQSYCRTIVEKPAQRQSGPLLRVLDQRLEIRYQTGG